MVAADWKIADGAGDYNGDGKADILWRNNDGTVAMWLMNGTAITSGAIVGPAAASMKIMDSAGDYNGDGKDDILWRDDSGLVVMWGMNGATIAAQTNIQTVSADWHLMG